MSNRILQVVLILSSLLAGIIFFAYKGVGWPGGREGIEALVAFGIFAMSTISFSFYLSKSRDKEWQPIVVKAGLWMGLLWIAEIGMNNLLRPGLPMRDIYDDIFWGVIAVFIFIVSARWAIKNNSVTRGLKVGFWSGFSSGAVAALTALGFIVFGMKEILSDSLNMTEWRTVGSGSGVPNMEVYFVYQTLAGAVLHLVVLGVGMGVVLGVVGGIIAKIANKKR